MTNAATDWTSAIWVLVAGIVVGAIVVTLFVRRRAAAMAGDLKLRDLEAKRDALLQELRNTAPEEAEHARLEREAADVLRAIDEHKRSAVPLRGTPRNSEELRGTSKRDHRAADAGNPALRGFLWGAGSVGALALLAYFVMQQAKPRAEGEEMTGNINAPGQQQAQQQQQQTDPVVQQLEAAVRQSPDNLDARNELAKAYLERDNLMGVFEQTQYVLTKSPADPRALTYQSIVRMAMGDAASATRMLDQATSLDPKLLDAWVALAWVRFQTGKAKEAEAAIAEAARQHPEEKPRLDQLLQQMRSAASQPQQASGNQLPPDHPPIDAAPPSDPKAIRVSITVDPAARARAGSGIVFVIARPAGVAAGPPAAARRLTLADLGAPITISSADSMMGQPLPDKVRIDVRLDSDGDPTTRPASDPAAFVDNVAAGAAVSVVLK